MMSERTIIDALKYPFSNWVRLFNFWWVIIPILGWFAVVGYFMEIAESMLKKKYKELPEFDGFFRLFKKGFIYFLVMLVPMIIAGFISGMVTATFDGPLTIIGLAIAVFIDIFLALLFINYVKKQEYESVFDVKKVWEVMSKNWSNTIVALIKQVAVMLLLVLLSIPVITMILTIPAMVFVGYYFMVDLYNKTA